MFRMYSNLLIIGFVLMILGAPMALLGLAMHNLQFMLGLGMFAVLCGVIGLIVAIIEKDMKQAKARRDYAQRYAAWAESAARTPGCPPIQISYCDVRGKEPGDFCGCGRHRV